MIVIMVRLLDTLVQGLDFMVIILDLHHTGAEEGVIEMKVRQGILNPLCCYLNTYVKLKLMMTCFVQFIIL